MELQRHVPRRRRRPTAQEAKAIYKPVRGERPLWDFPSGLHRREVAAWELSEYLGWHLVPPTIMRDGPFGEGSLQLFVAADFEQHYFTLYEGRADLHDALRRMCAFDLLANNTDRKSGHCLLGLDGRIWGIDHGLCFAEDFKLRTVIWEFGGERGAGRRPAGRGAGGRLRAAGGGDPPRRRRGGRAPAAGGGARGPREVPDRHAAATATPGRSCESGTVGRRFGTESAPQGSGRDGGRAGGQVRGAVRAAAMAVRAVRRTALTRRTCSQAQISHLPGS